MTTISLVNFLFIVLANVVLESVIKLFWSSEPDRELEEKEDVKKLNVLKVSKVLNGCKANWENNTC